MLGRATRALGSLLLVAGLASGCSGSGDGTVTLTYVSYVPESNPHSVAHEAWMAEVEKRTDGAVKFEAIYNGALCDSANIMTCVRDGRADIGIFTPLRHPAEFPLTNIMSIPFQTTGLQSSLLALRDLYESNDAMRAEFESMNQKLLYFGPVPAPILGLRTPISSMDDLDGMQFRIPGLMSAAFATLGVSSVTMTEPEIYESLDRGVIDGAMTAPDGHESFRTFEVVEQFVDVGRVSGPLAAMTTTMNADRFNALPQDVQAVINEVSAEFAMSVVPDYFAPSFEATCEVLKSGAPMIDLAPADEAKAWAEAASTGTQQAWLDTLKDANAGVGPQLLDAYHAALRKYESELTEDVTFSSRCEASQ
ncbi:TRAP transporter substrate-binding protein DctP [Nocardioides sp. AE5]|uniref:TRAP transporter substrate-binding protein DctP n=1 Tax=Nocardioides sp. AE5 TaxID=2962573 RepID=UPI0028810AA3|nr:TRAP transporter substrate-binding protein DctP [Nocardioides sp. AE5]MDT0202621.1 TRAP transporter substrate-binding protein DctP [Nocardioides sp. AE5]